MSRHHLEEDTTSIDPEKQLERDQRRREHARRQSGPYALWGGLALGVGTVAAAALYADAAGRPMPTHTFVGLICVAVIGVVHGLAEWLTRPARRAALSSERKLRRMETGLQHVADAITDLGDRVDARVEAERSHAHYAGVAEALRELRPTGTGPGEVRHLRSSRHTGGGQ